MARQRTGRPSPPHLGPELELAREERRLAAEALDTVLFIITLGIGWLVWFLVEATNGQTPAKRIFGMRVVRSDGSPVGWRYMVLRDIVVKVLVFLVIDQLVFYLVWPDSLWGWTVSMGAWALAAMWCTWDRNVQCLWDKVLRTHVIRTSAP